MADQIGKFEGKFASLVDKACHDVRERKLEPSIFLFHVTTLGVSECIQHRSFIKKELTDIPLPVTFHGIWTRLNTYWDFLNYGLLEHIISKFGSQGLKRQMQDYVMELSDFKRRTRLCDFIDSWPVLRESPPKTELQVFVVSMKHDWDKCTLDDLDTSKGGITCSNFFLPDFADQLKERLHRIICKGVNIATEHYD